MIYFTFFSNRALYCWQSLSSLQPQTESKSILNELLPPYISPDYTMLNSNWILKGVQAICHISFVAPILS